MYRVEFGCIDCDGCVLRRRRGRRWQWSGYGDVTGVTTRITHGSLRARLAKSRCNRYGATKDYSGRRTKQPTRMMVVESWSVARSPRTGERKVNQMRRSGSMCALFALIVVSAVTGPAAAQTMSLSLTANSSQLFCYTNPPPAASPMSCAYSEQYASQTSLTIVTTAAPWPARHRAHMRMCPHPLSFTHTNGTRFNLQANAFVVIGGQTFNDTAMNDVWARDRLGNT